MSVTFGTGELPKLQCNIKTYWTKCQNCGKNLLVEEGEEDPICYWCEKPVFKKEEKKMPKPEKKTSKPAEAEPPPAAPAKKRSKKDPLLNTKLAHGSTTPIFTLPEFPPFESCKTEVVQCRWLDIFKELVAAGR